MRRLSSRTIRYLLITFVAFLWPASNFAQQPFNKNEFVARRAKLFEKIPDGIAVIFAARGQFYPVKFR